MMILINDNDKYHIKYLSYDQNLSSHIHDNIY